MPQLDGFWRMDGQGPFWRRLLVRWVVIAFGVVIAAHTSPGISYNGHGSLGAHGWMTLALVALALSLFNVVLKPLLVVFTLPFVVMTLGLGLWLINAVLFMMAGSLVPGFEVAGFGSALWGALVVSVVSFLVNTMLWTRTRHTKTRVLGGVSGPPPTSRRDSDDVIDV